MQHRWYAPPLLLTPSHAPSPSRELRDSSRQLASAWAAAPNNNAFRTLLIFYFFRSSRLCIRSPRTTSLAERGWRAAASAARKRRRYCAACPTSGPLSSRGWEAVLVFRDTGDGRTSQTMSCGATCRSRCRRTACAGCGWKARCGDMLKARSWCSTTASCTRRSTDARRKGWS
ncbi:unnamed protein product [Laminaria digitata]